MSRFSDIPAILHLWLLISPPAHIIIAVGRRVDGLEQRLGQQDAATRGLLEQVMKIQQDFKVCKNS